MNENDDTSLVPYEPRTQVRSDDPVALVNEFSSGYVNKMTTNVSKVSSAIGINAATNQLGLSKYNEKWTPETTKNILAAIGIIMLLNKFKNDGIPFLKSNWKPVGGGVLVIAYLLFKAKEAEEQSKLMAKTGVNLPVMRG
jgi:hypothetical protein